jgi:hypothetical protein
MARMITKQIDDREKELAAAVKRKKRRRTGSRIQITS